MSHIPYILYMPLYLCIYMEADGDPAIQNLASFQLADRNV